MSRAPTRTSTPPPDFSSELATTHGPSGVTVGRNAPNCISYVVVTSRAAKPTSGGSSAATTPGADRRAGPCRRSRR
ncbi:MAG: hypothetical protein JNL21_34580 [Myxococcales bacterium]|nr:hypothetical protein [Myxococcales bacterium]